MNCCKGDSIDPGVDKLLSGARLALVASQGLSSIVPIPGMGPVTNVLISLIDKIAETRSNSKGLNAVSREVNQLVNTVDRAMSKVARDIEEIPSGDPRRHALVEGLRASSKLETRVTQLFNSRDAKTLEEIRKGVAACREYFKLECQVAIEASMEEVLEKLSGIEKNFSAVKEVVVQVAANHSYDRDERILDSLPHAEASYRAAVNGTKSNFLPGTRVELFHALNQWVERRSPELSNKAVCILTGGAGTGKSTIASEFARRRDDKKDYGASFFFVRGVADLDSTRLVFPTLAYQLAQSQDALRAHIVNAAHEHLKRGKTQQMKYEAPNLLHQPVHEVSGRHPPMFLVIDALDECSEETRALVPEMLELLIASVRHARFPLRIFFTSRPNSLIENTLLRSQWAPLVHTISLHDLSPESVQRDMAIFVRDKLEKLPSGQALLQQQPEVASRLAERAGGLFVYAKTAMDFLGDYPGFVEDGLDELLSEGSSEFAAALQPLDDLYLTVLEIAFPSKDLSQMPRLRQALESTLGNVAVLRNPMSPAVLESLTGVSRREIGNVLQRLRAVVLYDADPNKPDQRFRPMHATFPQFLLDPNRCRSPWYRVDARRQHALLAAGCLRALEALEENMCRLPDPTVPRAEIPDLAERLGRYVPEHVQYACAHWAAHLGDACGLGKKHSGGSQCACREIGERLAAFARTKLVPWVEMMAYMGRLDMVTGALDVARTYIEGAPQYQDVDSLLDGAQQLVVDHYSEIEECPYDVHQGSMPGGFSPTLDFEADSSFGPRGRWTPMDIRLGF
uniref:Glucose transporter rco-3 n=1 Tax=Ganoderma boninense TaxID=34458 RepID=A0A5K1JZ94_9APHY|nr:Glucose transporter rco-3 [Ganoderma boninense]